jgi:hypothetical protein
MAVGHTDQAIEVSLLPGQAACFRWQGDNEANRVHRQP